jgi:hypothetical protein
MPHADQTPFRQGNDRRMIVGHGCSHDEIPASVVVQDWIAHGSLTGSIAEQDQRPVLAESSVVAAASSTLIEPEAIGTFHFR